MTWLGTYGLRGGESRGVSDAFISDLKYENWFVL